MSEKVASKYADVFSLSGTLKRLWRRFPEAAVISTILTAVLIVDLVVSGSAGRYPTLLCGLGTGLGAAMVLGLLRELRPMPRPVTAIGTAVCTALGMAVKPRPLLVCILLWVGLVFVFLSLYTYRQPHERLGQLICTVILTIVGVFSINAALLLIWGVVYLLFLDTGYSAYEMFDTINGCIPCAGMTLVAPWLLLGLLPERGDGPERFSGFRMIIGKIFLPLYLVYLAVLLVYGLAILFVGMPVGVINGSVIAALVLYAALRLTLTGNEGRLSAWFMRWGALPLLPLIAAQAAAVWTRYHAYGLTNMRLIGMIVSLLCAAAVVCGALRRRPGWLFAVAAAIALVLAVTGAFGVNLSVMDQEARMKAALVRNDMWDGEAVVPNPDADPADKQIILDSYRYLHAERFDGWRVSAWVPESAGSWRLARSVSGDTLTRLFGFDRAPDTEAFSAGSMPIYSNVDLILITG